MSDNAGFEPHACGDWKSYTLPGWVSVKDALPDSSRTVLVYDDLEMFQAHFTTGPRTLPYFYSQTRGHLPEVTHWQALPEKPLSKPMTKTLCS